MASDLLSGAFVGSVAPLHWGPLVLSAVCPRRASETKKEARVNAVTAWFRELGESVVSAACPIPDRVRGELAERAEIEMAWQTRQTRETAQVRPMTQTSEGNRTRRGGPSSRQIPLRSGTGRITSAALPAISYESRNQ